MNPFGLKLFAAPPLVVATVARLALARLACEAAQSLNRSRKWRGKNELSRKRLRSKVRLP